MTGLALFLAAARKRVNGHRARVWAARGAAVSAVAALVLQLAARRWPAGSELPGLAAAIAVGAMVAVVGWLRARPSMAQVARLADRSLGGLERLSTAWELQLSGAPGAAGGGSNGLAARQREDAETWLATADPERIAPRRLPRRPLVVGTGAMVLAAALALAPNAGQDRLVTDRAAEAARERAADEIAALAMAAAQSRPGEDPARRRALLQELRQAEDALREAETTPAAVAALSRAQDNLRALAEPSGGRRDSAAAAGAALSQASAGSAAGAALAGAGSRAPEELERLGSTLAGLGPEQRRALAAQLREAAETAGGGEVAAGLARAADELAAGRPEAARTALSATARAMDQRSGEQAAVALDALAKAVPALSPQEQADLARALEQAASASATDPGLARDLAGAAAALKQGQAAGASAALAAAGQRAQRVGNDSALDSDVGRASNGVQSAKNRLLDSALPPGSQPQCAGGGGVARPAPPATISGDEFGCDGRGEGQGQGEGQFPGQGQGNGQFPGQGEGDGESQGQGQGQGRGQGEGQGQGQGPPEGGQAGREGPEGQAGPSGGARAPKTLGDRPGQPNEQIYVPGLSGPGRADPLPGQGEGQGTDSSLVPYESVYAEYRAAALSQADRQLIPEWLRELLRLYFQEETP